MKGTAPAPGLDDLSVTVMTHPLRRRLAQDVVEALRPLTPRVTVDPRPWETPRTLRTSIEAWADAARSGAAYHLVVQDDARLGEGFLGHLADLLAHRPSEPLALHSVWNSRNGSAVRWAAAQGARRVAAVDEYVPCLALLMPRRTAAGYVEFARRWSDPDTPDDVVVQEYFAAEGIRPHLTVPSLVDHRQVASLIGHGYGLTGTACFRAAPPGWFRDGKAVIDDYDTLPVVRQGRLWMCFPRRGATHGPDAAWELVPFEECAERLGYGLDALADEFDAFLDAAPKAAVDQWYRLVSPRVLWWTWTGARLLRTHGAPESARLPEPDPALVATSLRTLLLGGFQSLPKPGPVERVIADHIDVLYPVAAAGYGGPGAAAG